MMYWAQWNEVNSAPRGGEEMLCVVLRVRSNAMQRRSTKPSRAFDTTGESEVRGTLIQSTLRYRLCAASLVHTRKYRVLVPAQPR